jgi:thymidylate kinase
LAIWFGKRAYGDTRYKLQVWMKWVKRWVLFIDSVNGLRNTNQINILDRGVCTSLHGIITRIDISDIKPIGAALAAAGAFPDLMVVVDADPEIISERRSKRGNEQKFWQVNRDYEYTKYVLITEFAESILQETGGKLIRVISNNQDSIQKNVNRICDEIINHNKEINDVNKQA